MLDNEADFKALLALMGSVVGTTIDLNITENSNGAQLVDYNCSSPDGSVDSIVECEQPWKMDYNNDVDLLPTFSSNRQKDLLSAAWVNCISHVRQKFEGGTKEF
ncbi:hypothetical protein U1Q18_039398, partial [Sarracenia purpurea var. burkii]